MRTNILHGFNITQRFGDALIQLFVFLFRVYCHPKIKPTHPVEQQYSHNISAAKNPTSHQAVNIKSRVLLFTFRAQCLLVPSSCQMCFFSPISLMCQWLPHMVYLHCGHANTVHKQKQCGAVMDCDHGGIVPFPLFSHTHKFHISFLTRV